MSKTLFVFDVIGFDDWRNRIGGTIIIGTIEHTFAEANDTAIAQGVERLDCYVENVRAVCLYSIPIEAPTDTGLKFVREY